MTLRKFDSSAFDPGNMSIILVPYLLSSTATLLGEQPNEAIKLLVLRPELQALNAFKSKNSGELTVVPFISYYFVQLFNAARQIDNSLHYYKAESDSNYVKIWQTFSNLMTHWYLRRFGRLPPLNDLIKPPFYFQIKELKRRKALIAKQLGHLYAGFCDDFKEPITVLEPFKRGIECDLFVDNKFFEEFKPSFWCRYKRKIISFGSIFYVTLLFARYIDISKLLQSSHEAIQALRNLWNTWIIKPLKDIYETVRFSKQSFTIVTPDVLQSDKEALSRMIYDYGKSQKISSEELKEMLDSEDISLVINEYEKLLKKPLRGALFGIKSSINSFREFDSFVTYSSAKG